MPMLRRNLPVPLYHQLKTAIQLEIEAGRWKPGEQLPTENALIARFGVSKITVRQALRELSTLGYIRREQGRGTFVQRLPLEEGPRALTSFTGEMRHHGIAATSQVLDQDTIAAPPDIAARLGITPLAPIFRLKRLRFADGEPMGLQTAYVSMALVPGINDMSFDKASLYEVFASRYELHPARAKETHVAVLVAAGGRRAAPHLARLPRLRRRAHHLRGRRHPDRVREVDHAWRSVQDRARPRETACAISSP